MVGCAIEVKGGRFGRAVLSCGVGGDSGDEDEVEALLVKK